MQKNKGGLVIAIVIILVSINIFLRCPFVHGEEEDKDWLKQKYDRVDPLAKQMKTLKAQGHFMEAREAALKMIKAAEEEWGPYYLGISEGLFTIGECYAAEKQYAEADKMFQRVLKELEAIPRSQLGEESKVWTDAFFMGYSMKIAGYYKTWGDLDKAQAVLEKALLIAKAKIAVSKGSTAVVEEIEKELAAIATQKAGKK